jgi:hypothetical protein
MARLNLKNRRKFRFGENRKIISDYARRPSSLDPEKARWNGRYGIASPDLVAMANELRSERWMGLCEAGNLF